MILTELEQRVSLDRGLLRAMPETELASLIRKSQGFYFQGLAASRCGEEAVARSFYRQAFGLLPTHIEALDNLAIGLVEELQFAEAIPMLEQSAYAEPASALAFLYLTKCYQETGQNRLAFLCIKYLEQNWPDKSPVVDWGHLGKPQPPRPLVAPPYAEGQVWKGADCHDGDELRVWVRLVDLEHDQPVVHVSVVDAVSPEAFISHLPFSPDALSQSELVCTDERQKWNLGNDHFGEGFATWREAFDDGKAGVFTAPVYEVTAEVLKQMKRR